MPKNIGVTIATLGKEAASGIARKLSADRNGAVDVARGTILSMLYGSAVAARVGGMSREQFIEQAEKMWEIAQTVKHSVFGGVVKTGQA